MKNDRSGLSRLSKIAHTQKLGVGPVQRPDHVAETLPRLAHDLVKPSRKALAAHCNPNKSEVGQPTRLRPTRKASRSILISNRNARARSLGRHICHPRYLGVLLYAGSNGLFARSRQRVCVRPKVCVGTGLLRSVFSRPVKTFRSITPVCDSKRKDNETTINFRCRPAARLTDVDCV